MVILEGPGFHCYIHNFETTDLDEWNEHCWGNPEHTESGHTACIECGTNIEFEGLPFHKLSDDGSKNIRLRCEDCDSKMTGSVKRIKK